MDQLIADLTPAIVAFVSAILGYILVMAEVRIKRMTGLEMESHHRTALHSALESGVEIAFARIVGKLSPEAMRVELIRVVTDYVKLSVPDALKALAPSETLLRELALSKIERRLSGEPSIPSAIRDVLSAAEQVASVATATAPAPEPDEIQAKILEKVARSL